MSQDSILIVDSNEAFATILQEGLEQSNEYTTTVTGNGAEARRALQSDDFALVIIDLGLEDPDGITLARAVREERPEQPLMLIPLMGEELPPEATDLNIQGVLSKPFFFPELPGIIGSALGRGPEPTPSPLSTPTIVEEATPVAQAPPAVTPAPSPYSPVQRDPDQAAVERLAELRGRISEKRMQRIVQAMNGLAQDLNADVVLLSCAGGLVAHAGRLATEGADGLAQVVSLNWYASARVAQILGREQIHFEQSVDGGQHMLYSIAIAEDIILSTAMSTSSPLGMVRHSAKATATTLQRLIG
jgi:DNA-binding response OmpR family regulator